MKKLIIIGTCILLTVGLVVLIRWFISSNKSSEKFDNSSTTTENGDENEEKIDCDPYTFNQTILHRNTKETMERYALAASVWELKNRLGIAESDDLTRAQLEELPAYTNIKAEFFPGDTNLGIRAFNDLIRRNFDHETGKLSNYSLYSGLRELDNQCDIIPEECKTDVDTKACDDINLMINTGAPEINEAIRSNPERVPFSPPSSTPTTIPPLNEITDIERAVPSDIVGVPPVSELSSDVTADGADQEIANSRNADLRTDPTYGVTSNGPQSPSMVDNGRADETNPLLNRDAQRLYRFVLDKLAALYSSNNHGGSIHANIGNDLRSAIDGLSDDQRAALCSAYCGQFTPCSELCRYMGCINCTVGNTSVDRQNPNQGMGGTGGGIGDAQIDMRGMVLPGSARITDDYMLLDSKVIEYQATSLQNRRRTQGDVTNTLRGLIDMGDDMKGVVNVFAPTIHVHSKPQS